MIKDYPVPSLDKEDIDTIEKALIAYNYEGEDRSVLISKLESLLQNGVETDNVKPEFEGTCFIKSAGYD